MPEDTFESYVARERERLHGEQQTIFAQLRELEDKLGALDREVAAIDAYEAAKTGKALKSSGKGPRSARRGSKREALLQVLRDSAAGLKRGEILEKMDLKGNKSGEMSVSNALTALTKNGQVVRREGRYRVV